MRTPTYLDGHRWAAGELLAGTKSSTEIEATIFGSVDEFDKGAGAALNAWSRSRARQDALLAALEAYVVAKPQCECTAGSGCTMAEARTAAKTLIAQVKGEQA